MQDLVELATKAIVPLAVAVILALIAAGIEYRIRKIVDARLDALKFEEGIQAVGRRIDLCADRIGKAAEQVKIDLRTELQKPIGEQGLRLLELEREIEKLAREVAVITDRTNVFWRMIEESTADLLLKPRRQSSEDQR